MFKFKYLLLLLLMFIMPITSASLTIVSPSNNSEILNSLSAVLNITLTGTQNATYSWNNGIKNTTLCTNCVSPNWTTITFPRQNYYNISVWATNSSGSIQSANNINIFVGNYSYQENANWNTTFDLNNGNNLFDGDWDTFSSYTPLYGAGYGYANYTLNNALNFKDIKWQVKDVITANYSIPDNCRKINNISIKMEIYSAYDGLSSHYCYNYSSNNYVRFRSQYSGSSIYEEAVNWFYYSSNIAPLITNTLINYYNSTNSQVNFTHNISDDNDYLTNISLFIDGIRNITNLNVPITANVNNSLSFNISVPDGIHSWFIRTYDSDGLIANSSNFTFRVDTTGPSINIVYPIDYQSFDYKVGINVNFTRSDIMFVDTCWWSNSSGVANYTLSAGANISVTESADGTYTGNIWCNDSLNNIGTSSIHYIVSQNAPAITTNSPTNNQYLNYKNNIYFNFTASDSNGLSTCELWGNWTGTWSKNYTWIGPNSGVMNYTIISFIPDGKYKYNVWCNDTTNTATYSATNRTFTIDTIYPEVNVTGITTTSGSQTITFTHTATDLNLYSCKYSIFNSSGNIEGLYNNISFICGSSEIATVSAFATYNLTVYAIDYAGNENSSTRSFTTEASLPLSVPGGGGTTIKTVSAVAIKQVNSTARNDLSRCIIYSRIRELCINKTTDCSLNMTTLKYKIFENNLDIPEDELEIWFEHYKLNDLESVQVLEDSVVLYKLFTGVLQITSQKLKINPSRLDPFFTFVIFSDEFKYPLESNREIKNFSINGDMGLSLEKVSTTKLFVVLKIPNHYFSFKTFTGRVNIIDIEGNSAFVDVNLRVVNLKNTYTIITLIGVFSLIFIVVFNKKIKKIIKI